jgi:hypothetical protein
MPKGIISWYKQDLTIARITAFIPGESPPEVRNAIFFMA